MNIARTWLIEAGLLAYKPNPWPTEQWNTAYASDQLQYFDGMSECARYGVITAFLEQLIQIRNQENYPGTSILDAGCGAGELYRRAHHLPFLKWAGRDLSTTAIEKANVIADTLRDDRVDFQAINLLNPDEKSHASYDIAVLNEVLYMSDDPKLLLRLTLDNLQPHGYLIISGWRHRGDRQLWKMIEAQAPHINEINISTPDNHLAPRGWRVIVAQPHPK